MSVDSTWRSRCQAEACSLLADDDENDPKLEPGLYCHLYLSTDIQTDIHIDIHNCTYITIMSNEYISKMYNSYGMLLRAF